MMSRWGLEGMGSFEQARVASKEIECEQQQERCGVSDKQDPSATVEEDVKKKGDAVPA
jgi:hypothetical protein